MNIYYIDKSIRMQYMLENVKYIVFDYMPSSLKDLNRFLGDIIDGVIDDSESNNSLIKKQIQ